MSAWMKGEAMFKRSNKHGGEVDVSELETRLAGSVELIDVREEHEFVAGHIPSARLVSLSRLDQKLAQLPRDRQVFVVCATGVRSKKAAGMLRSHGVQAINVKGGTAAWQRAGKPLQRGR